LDSKPQNSQLRVLLSEPSCVTTEVVSVDVDSNDVVVCFVDDIVGVVVVDVVVDVRVVVVDVVVDVIDVVDDNVKVVVDVEVVVSADFLADVVVEVVEEVVEAGIGKVPQPIYSPFLTRVIRLSYPNFLQVGTPLISSHLIAFNKGFPNDGHVM